MYKLGYTALASGCFAALFLALQASQAAAQLTIQSTGTISGTLEFPFGPATNGRVTSVQTDQSGTYYRNIGTTSKPNLVPVYTPKSAQSFIRKDGSLFFVNYLGLQFISFNGQITSPVLSGGKLTPYKYQGRSGKFAQTTFQASVQDELALQKAFYTGTVTDPKSGKQYQGTFELRGQGPRYSDRNGGDSPTVFDFRTERAPDGSTPNAILTPPKDPNAYNPFQLKNVPLVRLTVTVPAGLQPISPSSGGTVAGGTTGGGGTVGSGTIGGSGTVGGGTIGGGTIGGGTIGGGGTGSSGTVGSGGLVGSSSTVVGGGLVGGGTVGATTGNGATISSVVTPDTSSFPTPSIDFDTPSPSIEPEVEFSTGQILAVNSDSVIRQGDGDNDFNLTSKAGSISNAEQLICSQNTGECRKQIGAKRVGPRSRVLVR